MLVEQDNVIELKEFFFHLLKKKIHIGLFSAFTGISALIISLTFPDIYLSEAKLVVANDDQSMNNLSRMTSQLGGLASLAGLNVQSENDESAIALEVLESRQFILELVNELDIAPSIFASTGWNKDTRKVEFDSSLYDENKDMWLIEGEAGTRRPFNFEIIDSFKGLFSKDFESDGGFLSLSFKHHSPEFAKFLLEQTIVKINSVMRDRALTESEARIDYLNEQIKKTDVATVKTIFFQLVESELQKKMLAETRPEYVFKVIDPPYFPEEKTSPKRAVISLLFAFLGLMLAVIFYFYRFIFSHRSEA